MLVYLCRFIARRGQMKKLISDNGSNCVGAERKLTDTIKENQDCLLQRTIEWSFNPPVGFHHSRIWGRMVRPVRKVLNSVVTEQILDEKCFRTVMCEIESVWNKRPIPKTLNQNEDLEALTLNHLLNMWLSLVCHLDCSTKKTSIHDADGDRFNISRCCKNVRSCCTLKVTWSSEM